MVYTNMRKKALYKSIAYRIVLPLPDGMREAIDEARLDDESRAAFIRTAVENELARRLRKKAG